MWANTLKGASGAEYPKAQILILESVKVYEDKIKQNTLKSKFYEESNSPLRNLPKSSKIFYFTVAMVTMDTILLQ